ncbi:hypothetical protein C8R44DRAFT_812404, partial [Mycena epipterygia]
FRLPLQTPMLSRIGQAQRALTPGISSAVPPRLGGPGLEDPPSAAREGRVSNGRSPSRTRSKELYNILS